MDPMKDAFTWFARWELIERAERLSALAGKVRDAAKARRPQHRHHIPVYAKSMGMRLR